MQNCRLPLPLCQNGSSRKTIHTRSSFMLPFEKVADQCSSSSRFWVYITDCGLTQGVKEETLQILAVKVFRRVA